jgi:amino acid adenylation domain-containing protein
MTVDLSTPLAAPSSTARIFDRFLAVCAERPEATAIVHPGGSWTYAQLDRASRALAGQLLARPAADNVVALYGRRSGELVVAMLACLRAGLTFAVLDAGYPVERLQLLLEVLRPGRFVAIGAAGDNEPVLARLTLPPSVMHLERIDLDGPPAGALDEVGADAIAYLLFTSGTTGVPKCIATPHTPLVHFIDWYARTFAVDARCRFSMLSGLGHDPVLRDVFVPLSTGAELHIPSQASVLDPTALYGWLAEHRISHAHVTPQLARIVCAGRRERDPLPLRFVFSGGDALRTRQANDLLAVAPSVRVVNFYGATETPQAMGYHVFDPSQDSGSETVPIGRGIADVQLLVLDDALALAAPGARGQIAIRTRYLSAGYRDDPELTNRKFVANPHAPDPTDRFYLTGDAGHWRADGTVLIEGRLDDQVKIRGFRVELGDVVHHLERIPQVREAVVLAEQLPDGERRLVAYLVGESGATAAVRDAISAAVPAYMVPGRYVWLPSLPLLPNGKIDRAALVRSEPAAETTTAQSLDSIEAAIVENWKALLLQPAIDADSSFVDLGGDSLSFIEASVYLEDLLGQLPERWERLSIRELARHKRGERSRWSSIDSSVLLRAISIVAVVVGHYEMGNLAGSVLALLVVSGMSFGRYLAPAVTRTGTVTPILRLVAKIAIPTVLYSLFVNCALHFTKWPGLLMVNNLMSSSDIHVIGVGFWYIDVLVQCFLFLAVLLAFRPARRVISGDPFTWLVCITLLFDGIAVLGAHTTNAPQNVPYQHIGIMFLGWAVIHAGSLPRKLLLVAMTVPTFGDEALRSKYILAFPFVATIFLIFSERVSLPRHLGRLVNVIASASLFIYLFDHQLEWVIEKTPLAGNVVKVPIAVVAGVIGWNVWESVSAAVVVRLRPQLTARARSPASP